MNTIFDTVTMGAFEAKTKFSELLSRVAEKSVQVIITKHGHPVAVLKAVESPSSKKESDRAAQAVDAWCKYCEHRQLNLGGLNIKDLINEGRP